MTTTVSRHVPPQRLVDLVNPLVRTILRSPAHRPLDDALLLLHVTGRRTGRVFDIPVGYVAMDDRLLVVTQHAWRSNLRGGAEVDVTLGGRRRSMHAQLDENPVSVARTILTIIDRHGVHEAQRRIGLTFKPGKVPSHQDVEAAARTFGLAFVTLSKSNQPQP